MAGVQKRRKASIASQAQNIFKPWTDFHCKEAMPRFIDCFGTREEVFRAIRKIPRGALPTRAYMLASVVPVSELQKIANAFDSQNRHADACAVRASFMEPEYALEAAKVVGFGVGLVAGDLVRGFFGGRKETLKIIKKYKKEKDRSRVFADLLELHLEHPTIRRRLFFAIMAALP